MILKKKETLDKVNIVDVIEVGGASIHLRRCTNGATSPSRVTDYHGNVM